MRTTKKWMTAIGALVACLSIKPAFADGDGHRRGDGGGQHAHQASPIPAQPHGGGWNRGTGGGWNAGTGGGWNAGTGNQWRGSPGSYGSRGDGIARGFNGYRDHDRDRDAWRGGRWAHVEHGGRFGWWWVAGPSWYAYSSAVYPSPPAYGVWTEPAPVAQSYYYCPSYQLYYPDVTDCPEGWALVAP